MIEKINASEEGDSDIEEYSSMEQPPLIKQLKTILAEYPDDGQIIKELLQNAEDAGASEVKILYDDRCINTQVDNKNKYRKFLKGPALCFFNDAKFTDLDWRGIKMIYSSVKEEDPLKVGRFGLGFKSVFHITDHPVVLSGDRIMFMDPHRNPDCVCLTIQLSKLTKWKKININDFFLALDGTFGVSREVLEIGMYNGTLFWFPLRSEASVLSDTLYNREKVMDLFTSFRTEASSILVFLKHLTKVSLYERKSDLNMINLQLSLEIMKNVQEVTELRKEFLMNIKSLNKSVSQVSINCRYSLSFCTKSFNGDSVVEEVNTQWMVVNYFKGGSMSEELRELIQDDSLGYCPLVGVAAPLGQNHADFKGHVYCFLPLPQKIKSLTGLPVHVNGFFALSQNRRHIKWPSAEQDAMHLHRDKSLMWNEKLLNEVLPEAYEILISEMVNEAEKNGNREDLVNCVYESIPRVDKVVDEWNAILPRLFGIRILGPTLMTVNKTGEKNWISCSEAFFATFCQYTNLPPTVKSTLVNILRMYDKQYVDVPLHVFEFFLKFNSHLTDISPQSFAAVLKEGPMYKSLSSEEKLSVLEFLTLDCCYEILEGLELLPLQDGSFTTFASRRTTSNQVLLCSKEEMELFPGLEEKFVYQADQNHWLEKHISAIVKQDFYQIQLMDTEAFQVMLGSVIQMHLGSTCPPTVRPFSILTGSWIQKVWEHIFSHKYDVRYFEHMSLIPLIISGSWSNVQEMELYQLKNFLIVKQMQNVPSLHEDVYTCLELLSIKVLPSLPEWLQRSQILQYIHCSTVNDTIQLLDQLYLSENRENLISNFNRSCEDGLKKEFAHFLAGSTSWTSSSKLFVRHLQLFTLNSSTNRTASLQEIAVFTTVVNFPVKFPQPVITGSYDECRLAIALGATELNRKSLVMETLKMMQGADYIFSEKQTFMEYFIQNIREFEHDKSILKMASNVSFLESNIENVICTPADLFDPMDIRLQKLFCGENRFPAGNLFQTNSDVLALKMLGLKTYNDLSATDLYETAQLMESWCDKEHARHQLPAKADQFLEVLKEKPSLLKAYVNQDTLLVKLMYMKCMPHAKLKERSFPNVLPWYQQQDPLSRPSELRLIKFSMLVGSTMRLIDCQSNELSEAFGWSQNPPLDKVLEQLTLLINVYEISYKPELLPVLNEIYQELSKYSIHSLLVDESFKTLIQNGCIWRGDGFSSPQDIFIDSKKNDLDLTPYLHKLPEEFKRLHSFFLGLGCNKEQNVDVFLKIQVQIKEKYTLGKHSHDDVKRDLSILISILNRLRQDKSEVQDQLHRILFPIHCGNESTLILKPGPECTYCNAQWLRDMTSEDEEDDIYYVHEDVSNMTAEELGVKSLTQQLLSDTEELAIEEWGQQELLTTRLRHLLKEGYQDGFSVPKEIVQNADDAGAKTVYFLYDERENEDAKVNLLDEGMADCQGPSLWAYNDANFQEKDFKNIIKLNGATKEAELDKIGKFGLGFCSVYNLTDVPSFISGSNIVILDPHKSHLGKALPGSSPGMRIDFGKMKNLKMIMRLKNQFKPFQNVFGCNTSCAFEGTLFRFPLRTASQAERSEISKKSYSKKECQDLLRMTIQSAGNLLLFTQHIQVIKIFHLPPDCKDPKDAKLIFSMTKEHFQDSKEETILSQVSRLKSVSDLRFHQLKRLQKIVIKETIEQSAGYFLPSLKKNAGMSVSVSWLISWTTGTDESVKKEFRDIAGALPLGAAAMPFEMRTNQFCPMQLKDLPLGFYKNGHLFCFLPLPILCDLPVHINGCFAVTSDRRQLMTSTEDDKKIQCSSWNKALIQDAVINAYIYLLEGIREHSPAPEYQYHSMWPLKCENTDLPVREHFIKKLVQLDSKLFSRDVHWESFSKCIFLDPTLRNDKSIGEAVFETLLTFHSGVSSVVMELPRHVMDNLNVYFPDELRERIVSKEQFFLNVFLPNIEKEFWCQSQTNINKRDNILIHFILLEHEALKEAISNTRCIPSEPNGALKLPRDLVNPLGKLSGMFSEEEEVFPRGKNTFRQKKICDLLVGLGMLDHYLPFSYLQNRCQSVLQLAQMCGQCAIERCSKILKYLSEYSVQRELEKNHDHLDALRSITFLPVLQKPSNWKFSWKGNALTHTITNTCHSNHPLKTIRLASPAQLFAQGTEKLVGCVELVLDEKSLLVVESRIQVFDVYKLLRLQGSPKSNVPYETVIQQLKTVAQEYTQNQSNNLSKCCQAIMHEIYFFLDKQCENSEELRKACFQDLSNENVILLADQIIDSSRIAFNLKHNCSPILHSLAITDLAKYKHLWKAIGVKGQFDVEDFLTVLRDKKKQLGTIPLSAEDIELVHQLLSALQTSMDDKGITYADIDISLLIDIVAPDSDGILRETSTLCLDDSEFETGPDTKTIHYTIAPSLALALGVKTKRGKCFDDFSCLIPSGQKEKLVTRLRGILSAYPCDDGIMRELLQNADDAQATEIHFIKDYRTHSCEKIFDEKYAPLQGPALCVFNNSPFTQSDIQGIHELGLGNKREDPLKTGQYGVGFNAVYHLTDAPSFLTKGPELQNGEILCVFDPTCQYLPKVNEQNPGVMCIVDKIRNNYPDVLTGYLEETIFKADLGTMFRFPLRMKKTPNAPHVSSKQVDEEEVNKMLWKFHEDAFDALLFVKNVSKITVSNISSGNLLEECRVEVTMSEEDRRMRNDFFQSVKKVSSQYKEDRTSIINMPSKEIGYTVTVTDGKHRSKSFYVVQRIGFKEGFIIPNTVKHALGEKNLGQLPLCGVAVLIPNIERICEQSEKKNNSSHTILKREHIRPTAENGRAFCFLPLPLRTGLPCHINGHFVLDHEARRSLWKEDKGYRRDWNHSLFQAIVSPAYISALLFLKQYIFGDKQDRSNELITSLLDAFHSQFPVLNLAKDDDWKAVVQFLYHLMIEDEVELFPVVQESIINSQSVGCIKETRIDWVSLKKSGNLFPAYFHELNPQLAGILKGLGMKLVDSPLVIKKSIKDSGNQIEEVSPDAVVTFLKSHHLTEPDRCRLQINVPISSTGIGTPDNVRIVIQYLENMPNFNEEIDQLPLLLTNDEILRLFLSNRPIIISDFWDVCQGSSEHFLHRELVSTCQSQKIKDSGAICELSVQKLEQLLPSTVSSKLYKAGKDLICSKFSGNIPNQAWIVRLWEFLYRRSVKYSAIRLASIDHDVFKENVKIIQQWSFLPVKQNSKDTFLLRPINQRFTIVDLYSFEVKSDLRSALERLNIPRIDTSIFSEHQFGHLADILNTLVASSTKPLELLNCLYYHKEKIKNAYLTIQQCNSFLVFFSMHIAKLKEVTEEWWIRDHIRALPLHITQQGTATSLDGNNEVLVIPTGMPTDGIGEWASKTGHILLRQNSLLIELHKFLGCINSCAIDIYYSKILPNFDALPQCHHIQHLLYISETLLQTLYFNDKQTQLIQVLKSTAFISTADGFKHASDFYDPFHLVFSYMCDEDDFPPTPFKNHCWNNFMKLAGLRTEVTEDKFVEFAEKLASEGAICVTKTVAGKCIVLIEFLFKPDNSTFKKNTFERLARIKFIPAHIVSKELLSICKQYSDCTSLICFSGSVSASFERLCWTSVPLLPLWINTKSEGWRRMQQKLGACSEPPIDKVVAHCQNICDTQKKVLLERDQNMFSIEFLKDILEHIYAYLFQHKDLYPEMKGRLKHTPVVLIPENCDLLPVSNIVIDLSEEDAVEPYLCKAPSYFGKYHDLFIFLGAARKVTCTHYFMVLESIYQKQKEPNMKLLPNEVIIVKKAIENLVKLLTRSTDKQRDMIDRTLYLPNRDLILKDAKNLIVSDLKSAEERLLECNLDFFVGFPELKIRIIDPQPIVKALPECCRPRLLSEIAIEHSEKSDIVILESKTAENIEQFLHSTDFLHGIMRLVKHMKNEEHKQFTRDDEEKLYNQIQNLRVRKVVGLYTYLILEGQRIQSSKKSEMYFIDQEMVENTIHYTMYFQSENENIDTDENIFYKVQSGIARMIRKWIEHSSEIFVTKIDELYDMLNCFKGNNSIDQTLDKHHIDPLDRPQGVLHSVFPPPGTYVPKEFHPFLEQGFSLFHRYEYDSLAYELEDEIDQSDNAEPVYIYVHIIRPLLSDEPGTFGVKQQYLIDIGAKENKRVYGYTLFKFERKQDTTTQELLPTDNVAVGSLPFDDICHQVRNIFHEAWSLPTKERQRILRRLMLRWHPDRNFGQEHYCTRVFMYIRDVVSRLDSGQSLDNVNINTNTNNCETRNVFTGTVYEDLGRRVNSRSKQYRQQHSEQQHTFYQAHTRKQRAYRDLKPTLPAPDQPNARRWMLQAKKDLVSARAFHPMAENVPAFNWICYHCQQATEKALKAAVYAKDANKVDLKSHQLASIATKGGLNQDLVQLAMSLQSCLGEHTRMRYPDPIARTPIPSDLYTDEEARNALEIAENVIQLVDANYLS
ncbi:hypothetical protein ACJMK2_004503 [Sinanodonta woodiana]|uniref:HEPN domain-containing protein n=1 Tax=Sinanodonta woodiana TaxID=1069815 RepID=A0ABD3Y1G0_SINWO